MRVAPPGGSDTTTTLRSVEIPAGHNAPALTAGPEAKNGSGSGLIVAGTSMCTASGAAAIAGLTINSMDKVSAAARVLNLDFIFIF
jgi:hypothetical protein